MHDLMKDNIIECFYGNYFKNNKLIRNGGTGKNYKVGDRVPYKTDWYNYTPNFNIILFGCDSFNQKRQIAIIRNGILRSIRDYNTIKASDWTNIERCINYKGTWLNIKSNEDVEKYIDVLEEFNKEKKEFANIYNGYRKDFEKLIRKCNYKNEKEEKENKTNINKIINSINNETLKYNVKVKFIKNRFSELFNIEKDQKIIEDEINGAFKFVIKTMKEYISIHPNDTSYKKNYIKCTESYFNYRNYKII